MTPNNFVNEPSTYADWSLAQASLAELQTFLKIRMLNVDDPNLPQKVKGIERKGRDVEEAIRIFVGKEVVFEYYVQDEVSRSG